ncbi:MAG: ANTAR domain-containing protein, partial [Clostridia bacterium]|nr:ANTAR domain-containing protein [Clostridia bacterium]
DFVFINSPLPDDTGARFAIDICNSKETVVLLMVRAELYDEIYQKVSPHGVFVLQKPTSKQAVATALGWMASARERLRKTEKKTLSIEEKMEEIRLVNRAKWLLISEMKIDEQSAHHYIEKQAMDRCISKRAAAEEIIKTYS